MTGPNPPPGPEPSYGPSIPTDLRTLDERRRARLARGRAGRSDLLEEGQRGGRYDRERFEGPEEADRAFVPGKPP